MRRLLVLAAFAAFAALAATAPAAAKGPSTASITGPGLDHALPVKGEGESGTDDADDMDAHDASSAASGPPTANRVER